MAHSLSKFGFGDVDKTTAVVQSPQLIDLIKLGEVVRTVNVPYVPGMTYRFRGYYVAGSVFEVWTGPDKNTPPPSAHSLIDVVIEGVL